jgi:hypothetical protein
MIDIGDLFTMYYVASGLVAVLAILWIVLEATERRPSLPKKSSRIFACGMEVSPGELNVPSGSYYDYLKRFLFAEKLAEAHSGDLSVYVGWILVGIAVIISTLMILW